MDDFELSEYFTAYLSDPSSLVSADYVTVDFEDALDNVIEALATDSAAVTQSNHFETLECILLCVKQNLF